MNPLQRLLRAIAPRAMSDRDAAELKDLRREVAAARRSLESLSGQVVSLQRQAARLDVLARGELDAPARMQTFEGLLDLDGVGLHARDAVARGVLADGPIPHLVVDDLLPSELFAAVVAAVPEEPFFEEGRGRLQEIRVPPPLAPVPAMVTWQFVRTLMTNAVVPALAARLATRLDVPAGQIEVTQGRILRVSPGDDQLVSREGPGDVATFVLYLSSTAVKSGPGSVLRHQGGPSRTVGFVANRALCVVSRGGAHQLGVLADTEPAGACRTVYEVRLTVPRLVE